MESYGAEQVRCLTRASRAFFEQPPAGFTASPILSPRGDLFVATVEQERELEEHWDITRAIAPLARRMDRAEVCSEVPVFRREQILGGVYEPDVCDMDVHALHRGYLREMRRLGGKLCCNAEVIRIERAGGQWHLHTRQEVLATPVIVNAAGAWADRVAALAEVAPLGIEPRRRSAFIFSPPQGLATDRWPAVMGAGEDWYIKPDAGMLLGSPANADPVEPHDVQAEELDIALAIDRIESVTTLEIRRPTRTWAGLRSFVPDGGLVGGFDPSTAGFFWVAAQGGYGIQTSAAMGEACAALARGASIPARLADFGINASLLSPARLAG